jgi:hypothetical protein
MESNKVASGGVVVRQGLTSKLTHTFTESGDFVVHRPVIIRYLIVGGRGGGPAPDDKSKIDQEGGVGEVVEGVSTYQLQPGVYKVTVGSRSTEFTEKQIAGTGLNTNSAGFMYDATQSCYSPYLGQDYDEGYKVYRPGTLNYNVVWTANRRNFGQGKASSISSVASAKGGVPHPGITTQPIQRYQKLGRHRMNWWYATTYTGSGTNACRSVWVKNPNYPQYTSQQGYNRNEQLGISGKSNTIHTMDLNDKSWKVTEEDAAKLKSSISTLKESDITGTKQMYGLKPMVVITYDESQAGPVPTTPAPTTPAPTAPPVDVDAIVKEYERKMAELRAAAEAEKQALQAQNAAAAEQARQIQEQLVRDLTALKAQYEQMKAAAESASNDLQTAKQELDAIKTSYDQKMAALAAAQKAELDALNAKNTAAVNEARAVQQQLVAEMTALKAQYDALVAQSAECPTIPEGAIVVDGKDGQLYKWDMAALRPMSTDTYRALGSPGYTTFPSGKLDKCPRGPVVVIETVAPTTPTPSSPSGPSDQTFPNTLYILVHAESWSEKGELKVLASRFGGATIEPFQYKALEQVFAINNNGYIRNLEGAGPYITSHDDCLAPIMSKETPKTGWKIQKTGESKYGYRLVSTCGTSLSASVGAREPMLEKPSIGVTDVWYILPVGRAEF